MSVTEEPGDRDHVLVLRFWRSAGRPGSFAQRKKVYEALRRGTCPTGLLPFDAEPFVQQFDRAHPGDLRREDAPGFRLQWTDRDLLVRLVDPDDAGGLLALASEARATNGLTGAPLNYEEMESLFGWE